MVSAYSTPLALLACSFPQGLFVGDKAWHPIYLSRVLAVRLRAQTTNVTTWADFATLGQSLPLEQFRFSTTRLSEMPRVEVGPRCHAYQPGSARSSRDCPLFGFSLLHLRWPLVPAFLVDATLLITVSVRPTREPVGFAYIPSHSQMPKSCSAHESRDISSRLLVQRLPQSRPSLFKLQQNSWCC